MRLVIALGGNALLKRGEALTAENQRRNMRAAAEGLARACDGHQVAIVHGNGPQVGLLALEAEAYQAVPPYPLDMLGAETQGMIGYLIAQELRNARPGRAVTALITQTLVAADDPAFGGPSKPIGPAYSTADVAQLRGQHDWTFAPDGVGFRRVVGSPLPLDIVEFEIVEQLFDNNVVTICAGGGGVPVTRDINGALAGAQAVIDKDLAAALLAERLHADRLVILTDVDAVYVDWGQPQANAISRATISQLRSHTFAAGSMAPKVKALCDFVGATGHSGVIGALSKVDDVIAGRAGTTVLPGDTG